MQLRAGWGIPPFRQLLLALHEIEEEEVRRVVRHLASFGPESITRTILGDHAYEDLSAVAWIAKWNVGLLPLVVRCGGMDVNGRFETYRCCYAGGDTLLGQAVLEACAGNAPDRPGEAKGGWTWRPSF